MGDPIFVEIPMIEISKSGWSGAGWQDAEIAQAHGLPTGVVVEIQMGNSRSSNEATIGAREYGSSLAATILLDEAKGGGYVPARTFVWLGDTGQIELYDDNVDDNFDYFITGYWANVTFKELWVTIKCAADDIWEDHVVDASSPNGVAHVIHLHGSTRNDRMGVREVGSSLDRRNNLGDVSGDGNGYMTFCQFVKLDADGEATFYEDDVSYPMTSRVSGVFGTELDYVEIAHHSGGFTGTVNVWENEDLTDQLDEDGRVVDYAIGSYNNYTTAATHGLRRDDFAYERKLLISAPDSTQTFDLSMVTNTDTTGIIEHISSTDPNYNTLMMG